MGRFILADGTGLVVATSDRRILSSPNAAYDADAVYTGGDPLPADVHDMIGGTFTPGGEYTKRPAGPDWSERESKWLEASDDWVKNGTLSDDAPWKRAVKSGNKHSMTELDWDNLVIAYSA